MLFAQMERRKAIPLPFPVVIKDKRDVAPAIEHVTKVWGELERTDFSHLEKTQKTVRAYSPGVCFRPERPHSE